jgi:iron(III) transport system ATP-binding protein
LLGDGFPGTVRKSSYLGDHVEMIVATPIGELFVISRQTDQIPAAGASVNLSFAPQGIALVR